MPSTSAQPELIGPIVAKGVKTPAERLAHVRHNWARGLPSLRESAPHGRRIDICGYGPSMADTWREIAGDVLTISGSHGLLLSHGIAPKFHLEVDPRDDKTPYIDPPCLTTTYLFASQCHPSMFDKIKGYRCGIWHAFNSAEEADDLMAILPEAEPILMGGSTAGLFALIVAYLMGFRDIHVHGMDSSNASQTQRHAGKHYGKPQQGFVVRVDQAGPEFWTTKQMVSQAREFFEVIGRISDAQITVHGRGLLQAMITIEQVRAPMPHLRLSGRILTLN